MLCLRRVCDKIVVNHKNLVYMAEYGFFCDKWFVWTC